MTTPTVDRQQLADAIEPVLAAGVEGIPRAPGVVGGVTTAERTVYLGAAGTRALDDSPTPSRMTTDSVFAIFSTTKAVTATVALQLVESGALDLDAPAEEYEPRLADVAVVEGIDDDGQLRLRAPASAPTVRQLLTHTAGFGYDFFDSGLLRLAREQGRPDIVTATLESLKTPLLFDPGTRWQYGINMDWAGLVIEAVTGQRLGDVMIDRIFSPLGMADTGFTLSADMRDRRALMHHRMPDGSLKLNRKFALPADPEVHMGGHGLYSTVGDYLKFIRMWLRDGQSDSGDQVLRPETIADAARNHIGDLQVTALPGVNPTLSNAIEFFPGQRKSWGISFLRNDEDAPTGRPAGSLAWAGLANLYYWIDLTNKIGGYYATQIFPFGDPTALNNYLEFESATYSALRS